MICKTVQPSHLTEAVCESALCDQAADHVLRLQVNLPVGFKKRNKSVKDGRWECNLKYIEQNASAIFSACNEDEPIRVSLQQWLEITHKAMISMRPLLFP